MLFRSRRRSCVRCRGSWRSRQRCRYAGRSCSLLRFGRSILTSAARRAVWRVTPPPRPGPASVSRARRVVASASAPLMRAGRSLARTAAEFDVRLQPFPGPRHRHGDSCVEARLSTRSHRCTPVRGARGRPRRDMEAVSDARFEGRSSRRLLWRSRAHARVRGRPVCGVGTART